MSASNAFLARFVFSRRSMLAVLCAGGLGAAAALPALAQSRGPTEVSVEELMKPVGLPDLSKGPADAKVTVVEYASMTCPHCAHFTKDVWPQLKAKYVDTGKVRFIFREYPLNDLAIAGSMLARCAGNEKAFDLIEILFVKQDGWAFGEGDPTPRLFELAKQAGFTQESFEKCLTDQKLVDEILAGRTRAKELFGVEATPTFFINGKKLDGAPTIESFDAMIQPLLAKS